MIRGQKTTRLCCPTSPCCPASQNKNTSNISIHNQKLEDNSSISFNMSKLSNIHQTYLYINRSQKITRLCSQTNQSQVTYIKHMYLYTIRGKKTTCLCPPNSSVLSNSSKWENYINLSVSSNLSKSSYIHQTFLNTIRS